MIRHFTVLAVAASLCACGERTDVAQQPDASPAATLATARNERAAEGFVEHAALSNLFEEEASRIVLERSGNAAVKAYAQNMIDDHALADKALEATLAKASVPLTPPTALSKDHLDDIADLRGETEQAKIDEEYIEDQIAAHQRTLNAFQSYANDGDNAALKAFAQTRAPMIQKHLDAAKALKETLNR